ncbi:50S ribosomal protein L33 [Chlamydiia bacterium]|jgi:ribosomal protein L33|nr:50S ribosomal protein L33 [Chlamydiia bacterium]
MVRQKVKMKCEETTEFYFTTKNKTLSTERLLQKRYSRKLRKHVNFKESK